MTLYFRTEDAERIDAFRTATEEYDEEIQEARDWAKNQFGDDTQVVWGRGDAIIAFIGDADEFEYMTSRERVDGQQTMKPDGRYKEGKNVKKKMEELSPSPLRGTFADIAKVPARIMADMTMYQTGFHFNQKEDCMYMMLAEDAYDELEDVPDFWETVHYEDVPENLR